MYIEEYQINRINIILGTKRSNIVSNDEAKGQQLQQRMHKSSGISPLGVAPIVANTLCPDADDH